MYLIKWKLVGSDAFEQPFEAKSPSEAIARWQEFWGLSWDMLESFSFE